MQPLRITKVKRKHIFEFIKFKMATDCEAPTIREIGKQFGMTSSGSVHSHLKKLEDEGLIRRSRQHRGIELMERDTLAGGELMIVGREG